MALEKATIIPEGKDPITVLFNPNQYSLTKGNQIAEIGIPGLGSPILQFVRGNSRTLTMDLFFDTYEAQSDVTELTEEIYGLLGILGPTHVPPICTFSWGALTFEGIVENVNGKYTLFLPSGVPVRATLSVTFKEHIPVDIQVRAVPTESADHTKTRTVKRGDTLCGIAAEEYDDPAAWRPIARANAIDNPRVLKPGRVLVIPPLTGPGGLP